MQLQMKREYMGFYFEGRDDMLDAEDVDVEKLAERCLTGPEDPYTIVHEAVSKLASPLEHDREKREWIEDYKDWIADEKADPDTAYRHYLKGRIDETTSDVLDDVLAEMDPRDDGEEEGDDEDDDEDDD